MPGDYGWLAETAANSKHAVQLTAGALIADAVTLATLELGADALPYYSWEAEFSCGQDGALDGLAGWFDCRLADDIRMSNAPVSAAPLNRPQAFLPLKRPVAVRAGETIRATVMARPGDAVIGWVIELPEQGAKYSHDTFNGLLLDREALLRVEPQRVAKLNARGRARQRVLSYCDGSRSLAEVQALIEQEHPALFPTRQAAVAFITHVLSQDTGP